MHVFTYGSLLDPESLRSTLPGVRPEACIPVLAHSFVRTFDVEFPNDGSQSDKMYLDPDGHPPARVLFCNIRPAEHYDVNGVCIPVEDSDLARLKDRERRYELVEITDRIAPLGGGEHVTGQVLAFVGKQEFTRGLGGVASREYLDTIVSGSRYWESRVPEFHHRVMASTLFPGLIADLTRVDP